ELTRQFRKRLPNASLSISEGLSMVMQEWLLAGRLDIALMYNPSPSADLDLSPLTSERLYLVGTLGPHPSDQPLPLQALVNIPLIIPNRPNTVRMLLESEMSLIGARPNIRLEIDSVQAILDLVADGTGYAVLLEPVVLTTTQTERYYTPAITLSEPPRRLCLALPAARITTLKQLAMLEVIRTPVG